jgi:hypothetical protein
MVYSMSAKHSITCPIRCTACDTKERMQMNRDNLIDISDLQNITLNSGDLRALIIILENATSHLILPSEATEALARLQKLIEHQRSHP